MNNALSASIIKQTCKEKPVAISTMLADCQISKSLMYDMEKRNQTPSVDVYYRIADYLNCSVDYLLGRERKQPTPEARGQEKSTPPISDKAKEMFPLFERLDSDDKNQVIGIIKGMLLHEKYRQETERQKNA